MSTLAIIAGMGIFSVIVIILLLPLPIMIWALINCLRNPQLSGGRKFLWVFLILIFYPAGLCRYPFLFEKEQALRTAVKILMASWALLGVLTVGATIYFAAHPVEKVAQEGKPAAGSAQAVQAAQTARKLNPTELYQKCQQKDFSACTDLGEAYNNGTGVKIDKKTATYYFTLACSQGEARGCGFQGEIMHSPWGTASYQEIGPIFLKGCLGKDDNSCSHLVSMVTGGTIGLTTYKDDVDSSSLQPEIWIAQIQDVLTTKCEAKTGTACASIGKLIAKGIGGKPDLAKALGYFEKGCDLENWDACGGASKIYLSGAEGVPKNLNKGMELASKSLDGSMKELKSITEKTHSN